MRSFFLDSLSAKVLSGQQLASFVLFSVIFSCKHRGGKINVYLLSHCLSSSISRHSPLSATARSPFTVYPSISNFSLSSPAIFFICFSPIFSFSPPHRSPPCPPSLYFPQYPPTPTASFPFSLSLPFFAQDRSALITLMALMIQLNGALSPQCLSKAFLCSRLMQQHSAVTEASALSLWAQ